MEKRKLLGMALLLPFVGAAVALASPGKGDHDDSRPAGWSQGSKSGWHSDQPPGLEKRREHMSGQEAEHEDEWDERSGKNGEKTKGKFRNHSDSLKEEEHRSKKRYKDKSEDAEDVQSIENIEEKSRTETREKKESKSKLKSKLKRED